MSATAGALRQSQHGTNAVRPSQAPAKEDVVKSLLAGLRYELSKGLPNTQVDILSTLHSSRRGR